MVLRRVPPEPGASEDPLQAERERLATAMREHGGVRLWWAWRAWQAAFRRELDARGHERISNGAHQVVLPHLDVAGTRVTVLAQRAQMSKQAIGQFVEQLSRLGYVEQVPDPADGRARIVRYTEQGLRFVADAEAIKARLEARMEQAVGAADWQRLQSLLVQVRAALEDPVPER